MAEPFISEIRMFGFGWPPRGWAQCDGQLLPINQNQALYSLLGTTYGGDGRTTFALPDMRGRVPVSFDTSTPLGNRGGAEYVTLTAAEMPSHTHAVRGTTTNANAKGFANAIFASAIDVKTSQASNFYTEASNVTSLAPQSVSFNGGGNSHSNLQPSLVLNYCIALTGAFPSRN